MNGFGCLSATGSAPALHALPARPPAHRCPAASLSVPQSDPSLLTPGKTIKIPPFSDNCVNGILIE